MDFVGKAILLTNTDIAAESQRLGCEPAAIWAVCDVESAGSGFLADRRPKILFEAKAFHTYTDGAYDDSHPNISSPQWDRSLYGASGAHQYDRLQEAITLDRGAALKSASWGRFQIMGFNHKMVGYPDVESFVKAMMDDEANHLTAFGNFCKSAGIVDDLIDHDWHHFALRYNGSGQIDYYAQKLADAYQRHLGQNTTPSPQPSPATLKRGDKGSAVTELQQALIAKGYPITVDGDFGSATEAAVIAFQSNNSTLGLSIDGIVGPKTRTALGMKS